VGVEGAAAAVGVAEAAGLDAEREAVGVAVVEREAVGVDAEREVGVAVKLAPLLVEGMVVAVLLVPLKLALGEVVV